MITPLEVDRLAITPIDRARSVLVLVLSLLQISSPLLVVLALGPGRTAGEVSDLYVNPITPPHWAFAIWGLIYLAMIMLGIYQVVPGQPGRELHRRTGWWLIGAMAAASAWVPLFVTGHVLVAELVLIATVTCLVVALIRLSRTGPAPGGTDQTTLWMPVALYLGWALVAAAAGVSTTLRWLGMDEDATVLLVVSVLLLVVATVVSMAVMQFAHGLLWVGATVVYAYVSLILAGRGLMVSVTATVLALLTVGALVFRARRSNTPFAVLFG